MECQLVHALRRNTPKMLRPLLRIRPKFFHRYHVRILMRKFPSDAVNFSRAWSRSIEQCAFDEFPVFCLHREVVHRKRYLLSRIAI